MDDTLTMCLGDSQGHLLGKARRPRRGPGRAIELLVQAAAGDVLQLEKGKPSASPMWRIWTI